MIDWTNRTEVRNYERKYYRTNGEYRERTKAKSREEAARRKLAVITHYTGGSLLCMGWNGRGCPSKCSDVRCLTIDHASGGGRKHRASLSLPAGGGFYAWLIRKGYPSGYQVLCANCQLIKKWEKHEFGSGRPPKPV
jgi:hypothetical protein